MASYILFPTLEGFFKELQDSQITIVRVQPQFIGFSSWITLTAKSDQGDIIAAKVTIEENYGMGDEYVQRAQGRLQEVAGIVVRELQTLSITDIRTGILLVRGMWKDIGILETDPSTYWKLITPDEHDSRNRYIVDVAIQ